MSNLEDMLKQLMDHLGDHDKSAWIQVGTLTSKEILYRKNLERKANAWAAQMAAMQSKAEIIKAKSDGDAAKWWAMIYKTHSLPRGSYTLTEDNKILMKPKRKKEDGQ